ncbi:MAG: RICIN domain-containing protein [Oscillospiraceae bacterium]|nr:RICIN domain-containing protein [Oscillospiraceae bacterium]
MNRKIKKLLSAVTSVCMLASMSIVYSGNFVNIESNAATSMNVEYLDKGISAINTGSGMLVSWRYLANDDTSTVYKLYRNDTLIYTSNTGNATCYLDKDGNASSKYKVETISGGKVVSTENCKLISNNAYFDLKLDQPTGSGCTYSPNDCSVGDVDGDGQYEIFVKWDPSNSQDNSINGKTGNVYIDCYRLDGTKLWRIDLGKNIRAGAHYTQFLIADFDLDGKAEMTCKTCDGTVDGQGNVIGDASKDYRNSKGHIITGNEYYTLFDGLTGKALDTVDYEYPRGTVSKSTWGDNYGNRSERYLGAVCYLDGNKPSAVSVRGYYTRMTAVAYDVVNKKLVKRWGFDTGYNKSADGYGDGNHNCMPADVDGDGKQELILGSVCLDDNGKVLWCYNKGHGDAMHLGDLLPERKGLELWICHEDKPYGVSLLDASNGKVIFHKDGTGDTGRCCADNVWTGNDGAEFWGLGNDVFDGSGNTLSCRRPAVNFLSYWDGDLEREILDGYTDSPAKISKMKADGTLTTLLSTDGYYTCNTTKGTPCLSADIFGDWREELIVRAADGKSIRIYATPYETDYRITTLMHDPQYRNQVAGQNIAYNQPPHASFYLGSEQPLPNKPAVTVLGKGTVNPTPGPEPTPVVVPAVLDDGAFYMIKNVNSGLYLEVANGSAENGANIQQWGAEGASAHNVWRAVASPKEGYYYLYSALSDGASYCLDLTANKKDNGTNIELYQKNYKDAQQFMFVENSDGSYTIRPKLNSDACVEVVNGSTESGANVQEWELNGASCQNWILEKVDAFGVKMDTSVNYMFKNSNSNLYMEVANASAEDNANVQQWGADSSANHNTWSLKDFGGGYYYIISQLADGKTYYLNIANGSGSDGANAEILTNNKTSSHLFKFIKNPDGTYNILTRASKDKSGLEIANAETKSGSNVQQWTLNGNNCQKWILESIEPVVTEPPTTAPPVPTTVTTAPVPTESKILYGDANDDGIVDVADVVAVASYVGNSSSNSISEKGIVNSDVHNSGDGLTANDALVIQQYLAKIITSLPA